MADMLTQTIASSTSATRSNIKKLKLYLSKDGNDRQNTKKKNK
jgi:hypothetical protein